MLFIVSLPLTGKILGQDAHHDSNIVEEDFTKVEEQFTLARVSRLEELICHIFERSPHTFEHYIW